MAAEFIMSAPTAEGLKDTGLPELAVAGRSNVGKSSLLNRLFNSKGLVRTSRTPGRTRLLNLFVAQKKVAFVDLPGYGYAKLSKKDRDSLSQMIRDYLEKRECLRGILLLVDIRRTEVSPYDKACLEWCLKEEVPVLVVLTKGDLVPKNQRLSFARQIENGLGIEPYSALVCSAYEGSGIPELKKLCSELTECSFS